MTRKGYTRAPAFLAASLLGASTIAGGCGGHAEDTEVSEELAPETRGQDLILTPLTPKLECIDDLGGGIYRAHFGYRNGSHKTLTVPVGLFNFFVPYPANQGQPTVFAPGLHEDVFSVSFNGKDGWNRLAWWLGGRRALATKHAPECPEPPPEPECTTAADCDDEDSCTAEACSAGTCTFPPAPAGTSCGHDGLCDGSGQCVECLDAADCDDESSCTSDLCSAGACSNPPAPAGTSCGHGGVCDGAGGCNPPACAVVEDCDDDDACTDELACVAGACVFGPAPAGTSCGHGDQCDGAGACVDCLSAADCDDEDSCTADICAAGTCSHPPAPDGTSCGHGGSCTGGVCS